MMGRTPTLVCVKASNNRESVAETVDFWDERVDSYFIDMEKEAQLAAAREAAMTPLDRALRALDDLAKRVNQQAADIRIPNNVKETS